MTFREADTHFVDKTPSDARRSGRTAADLSASDLAARPPGAVPQDEFVETCVQCGDCVAVCPPGALDTDTEGYPLLVGTVKCGQCGLCADICMHGAIQFTSKTRAGLQAVLAAERQSDA